jgi:hypothetical protein
MNRIQHLSYLSFPFLITFLSSIQKSEFLSRSFGASHERLAEAQAIRTEETVTRLMQRLDALIERLERNGDASL